MKKFYCILLIFNILSMFLQPVKNFNERLLLTVILLAFIDIEILKEENEYIIAYLLEN